MKPEPSRIEPIFSPRLWGSRSLAPLFPEKTNLTEPIGEAWLTGFDCKIASGPFAGKRLADAWSAMPGDWRGSRLTSSEDFPILVKFIFPLDKLSIQVHPDDGYATVHEQAAGGRGKTEMWHIVSAQPGAHVLVGLKPEVNKEKFLAGLVSNTLEELFEARTVQGGDTIFVPAGTPHTIGSGMVIFEVQEYSDLTYRVYDYGRVDAQGKSRELHIQKALEVIRFDAPPILPFQWKNPMDEFGTAYVKYLAACRYFAAERWDFDGWAAQRTDPQRFELLVVLKGSGHLRWDAGEFAYATGETWLLPASLGKYMLVSSQPGTELVRVYVPDITAFDKMIADKGYTEKDRRQFVFG